MTKPLFLFTFSLSLLFFSCGKETVKEAVIPEGILSEELFCKVLTDFALAESAANLNIKGVSPLKTDSVYAFDPLLENNVRKSQYDSTIQFYTKEPELYKKVYEKVLVRLSELSADRSKINSDSLSK